MEKKSLTGVYAVEAQIFLSEDTLIQLSLNNHETI